MGHESDLIPAVSHHVVSHILPHSRGLPVLPWLPTVPVSWRLWIAFVFTVIERKSERGLCIKVLVLMPRALLLNSFLRLILHLGHNLPYSFI